MSGFRYRLEVLLRLARVRRREQRRELADVMARRADVEERLEAIDREIESCSREIADAGRRGVDGATLAALENYRRGLQARRPVLAQRHEELSREAGQISRRLEESSRRVKVLEGQRGEKERLYLREVDRRRQAALDDMVLTRKVWQAAAERRAREEGR
ncbi:MAG: flagellar FliJ family protein [Acidobacteriota bacterium]|nr:flagellar FliJ family protein [Acidobacteriota bacterium]MDQ7087457.1 flagellar FliJ family protein [Acidobacteriota bacterium]